MKSLATIAIHGLALVGAHEIYKEYQLRKTLKGTPDNVDGLKMQSGSTFRPPSR